MQPVSDIYPPWSRLTGIQKNILQREATGLGYGLEVALGIAGGVLAAVGTLVDDAAAALEDDVGAGVRIGVGVEVWAGVKFGEGVGVGVGVAQFSGHLTHIRVAV